MSYESDIRAAFEKPPANFSALVAVLRVCSEMPDVSHRIRIEHSGLSSSAYYRAKEVLTRKGLLTSAGTARRTFTLPDPINRGQLPPVGWRATHLVAYLTRFKDDEIVPPYNITKREVIKQIKDNLLSNPLLGAEIVYGLQARLALLAIAAGDLTSFNGMLGKVSPPNNLENLI